jgi:hypothetical protein
VKRFAGLVALVAALIVVGIVFHDRVSPDLWPLDSSRVGPNLVASVVQWVIVLIVASFLYPPLREWFKGSFGKIHTKLDAHHAAVLSQAADHHQQLIDQADAHHAEHMQKLDQLK